MSRTYRCKQGWIERRYLGSYQELFEVSFFGPNTEPYQAWQARKRSISNERYYAQLKANFHSDKGTWLRGVPRWYRHQTGSHLNRVRERQKLIRCLQRDEWDAHLPDSRARGMSWYW